MALTQKRTFPWPGDGHPTRWHLLRVRLEQLLDYGGRKVVVMVVVVGGVGGGEVEGVCGLACPLHGHVMYIGGAGGADTLRSAGATRSGLGPVLCARHPAIVLKDKRCLYP